MRELRNVLERAAILCEGAPIDTSHLTLQSGAKALRNDTTDLSALGAMIDKGLLQNARRENGSNFASRRPVRQLR